MIARTGRLSAGSRMWATLSLVSLLIAACGTSEPAATPLPATAARIAQGAANTPPLPTATDVAAPTTQTQQSSATASPEPWIEVEVTFPFGSNELFGILTLPSGEGPFPAIVIISGSASTSTGVRSGTSARYHIDHARQVVRYGFAVLRYDPPGVGRSTGEVGFESLDGRTEEALAALHFLQSRTDVLRDRIGLWGGSQGAWVIAMAAAAQPEDVAFLVAVSGPGVSVAEQQVYSIQAQSQAAGMTEQDIARAILFGRLLVDWQLVDPIYREVNEADARDLGDGPWSRFSALVYQPGEIGPAEGLQQGIEILRSVQDEPWARFLYLKELYLPQLESLPPEQVAALKVVAGQSLLNDPKGYLTRVRCPLLAFFGEDDLLQPTERSAALYEQYLTEAGNQDYEIVVLPGVGHAIGLTTPGYLDALSDWLDHLYAERPTLAPPAEDTRARPADGMTMVHVPGGEFRMGHTWSLEDRVHTVDLDSFWIDQTEVTNAHYRHCVEAGACRAPTTCNWGEPTYGDASKTDHPVICVTWQASADYCRWAGGRLPTEAEWEYAARGPQATLYPWGDDLDGALLNSCDVNCPHEDQRAADVDDGHALTAPVGSYPGGASWCGALDMAGNVWEWVADWHGPYPLTRQTNPTGPESGSEKLIRGGSWYENDEYGFFRADNRHPFEPQDYNHLIGFRCVVPAGE
jgi:formylglycine-generating enzyme required for sulfatase activity/dienelactone hydrolase